MQRLFVAESSFGQSHKGGWIASFVAELVIGRASARTRGPLAMAVKGLFAAYTLKIVRPRISRTRKITTKT